jgi:hypothetical protein
MLRYLCKTVLDERQDDMDFFNQFVAPGCIERLEHIVQSDFEIKKSKQKLGCKIYFFLPHISKTLIEAVHREALKILKKKKDVMENPPRNIFGKINSKYYTFCKKCNAKTSVSSNKTPKGGSATA